MNKLIDADVLKERYKEVQFKDGMTERVIRWLIETNIDKAPGIVIVRCKECKHYNCYRKQFSMERRGDGLCDRMNCVMNDNDFCSCGEAKAGFQ